MAMLREKAEKVAERDLQFRLNRYQTMIDLTGIFVPLAIALAISFFPYYFPWLPARKSVVILFTILFFLNGLNFLLFQITRQKIFFHLTRYSFIAFFTAFIYITGGILSPYLWLMVFPLVVSAVDLDYRMTRRIAVIVNLIIAFLAVIEPGNSGDFGFVTQASITVIVFSVLSYYIYKLVRETLSEKYEKDEADRRVTHLVEVEHLKDDFLSIAQHQLRTPLSGARYALEALCEDASISADGAKLVASGLTRIKDALRIVNDMLVTADQGGDSIVLSLAPTDIATMFRNILTELNYVAARKKTTVHFEGPDSLIANIDGKKLESAFSNIVDNALKYSPKGEVKVSIQDRGKDLSVVVSDTGIGIPKDGMQFVFNRLYRADNAVSLEPDGTGVGLYTAKRMIELHKGSISLASEPGKGTTVTVTLPK